MDLPLLLQMELELSVAAHKRDLKEAFAKARERLVPVERSSANDAVRIQNAMMNMASPYWWSMQTGACNSFYNCYVQPAPSSLWEDLFGFPLLGLR